MKNIHILILALIVSGCSRGTICDRDPFFCSPSSTWAYNAQQLTTARVYKLHSDLQSYYRPPDYTLLPVLGKRGAEAIDAMTVAVRSNENSSANADTLSVLVSVKEESGYDACSDSKRMTALKSAIKERNGVTTVLFDDFCRKP